MRSMRLTRLRTQQSSSFDSSAGAKIPAHHFLGLERFLLTHVFVYAIGCVIVSTPWAPTASLKRERHDAIVPCVGVRLRSPSHNYAWNHGVDVRMDYLRIQTA